MNKLLRFGALALSVASFSAVQAADIIVTDNGSGTGTTTWTSDNVYILDGFIFVNSGQVLTIQEGTVIKGMPGTGSDASALIVARGGQIFAQGTSVNPIIFTAESDPLDGSLPFDSRGLWGGLIVLGNAQLNSTPGETQIEGIPDTEPRGLYGGTNDADNSGTLTYISIRHGGTDIGAGNEINGLTLGGVGSATIIDYVEVVSNADDGIEFFGGMPNVKHAVAAFCGDDSFDYDEGFRGKGQFWFTIQDAAGGEGDRGGEHDGGTDPEDGNPYATPTIYNATYIGRGLTAGNRALTFRDNAGGSYNNSIFANWARGFDVEKLASGEDSYARFVAGDLSFNNNCFYDVASAGTGASATDLFKISMGTGWSSIEDSTAALSASLAAFQSSFTANANEVANPGIEYVVSEGSNGLIPIPTNDVTAPAPSDNWFTAVTYKGAFDPSENCSWLTGWSFLDERGFLGCTNGISEIADATSLNVIPNPSNGSFEVYMDTDLNNANIQVVDLTGRVIYNQNISFLSSGNRLQVTLDAPTGIYLLKVRQLNNLRTTRVVVR